MNICPCGISKRQGFTLVELLIVIAVIALLAVVVLVALQPGEQLKKSRDAARKVDAEELYQAYERYFISFQLLPWEDADVMASDPTIPALGLAVHPEFTLHTDSYLLINKSELKQAFTLKKSIRSNELWVSVDGAAHTSVCFEPESKSARNGGMGRVMTKLNTLPSPSDCNLAYGTSTQCYICLP